MSCTPPSLTDFAISGGTTTYLGNNTWSVTALEDDGDPAVFSRTFTSDTDLTPGCRPTTLTAEIHFDPPIPAGVSITFEIAVQEEEEGLLFGGSGSSPVSGTGGTFIFPLEWFFAADNMFIGYVYVATHGSYAYPDTYTCTFSLNFSGEYTPFSPGPFIFDDVHWLLRTYASSYYPSYLGNNVWRYESGSYQSSYLYSRVPDLRPDNLVLDIEYPEYTIWGSQVTACPFYLIIVADDPTDVESPITLFELDRYDAPPGHTTIPISLDWSSIPSQMCIRYVAIETGTYTAYAEGDPLVTFSLSEPGPQARWTYFCRTEEF